LSDQQTDPVKAITEDEASGEIARIYQDIRESLGVPVVNLIWRHLATVPGALPWAWDSLKPLYVSGAITEAAVLLRASLRTDQNLVFSSSTLKSVSLSPDDLRSITVVLNSYERSNSLNLIALNALLAKIDGVDIQERDRLSQVAIDEKSVVHGEMPELLALANMEAEVRDLVEELNQIGGRSDIMPSMYRHLAHWPQYLALLHVLVKTIETESGLESQIVNTIGKARTAAVHLLPQLANDVEPLPAASELEVRDALPRFIEGTLGKMTTIIQLVSAAMPSTEQSTRNSWWTDISQSSSG
jgi:hypothetical protein